MKADLVKVQPPLEQGHQRNSDQNPLGGDDGTTRLGLKQGEVAKRDPGHFSQADIRLPDACLQPCALFQLAQKKTAKFTHLDQVIKGEQRRSDHEDQSNPEKTDELEDLLYGAHERPEFMLKELAPGRKTGRAFALTASG